jgi:dienelactone hydrolase
MARLARWRSELKRDFLACLGGFPWQCPLSIQRGSPKPLVASALNEIEYGGDARERKYTRERIVFEAEADLLTPAYLLVPDGADASTPTIVALEGHGFGVADIAGLNPDGTEQAPRESGYQKAFAVALAQRGFVVIAPELFGFGELRLERDIKPDNPHDSSCNAISTMLMTVGRTMAGVRVNQARRCGDALAELGYNQKPMAMGISGGELVCTYFTALDDRVQACCVSGFANTYRGCILGLHHCVDNYQPGLLLTADMPDILSLIAPRPMIWESGEQDPIFPIAHVLEAEHIVKRVYKAYGKEADFALDRFPADHQIHGSASYDFLWKHTGR